MFVPILLTFVKAGAISSNLPPHFRDVKAEAPTQANT